MTTEKPQDQTESAGGASSADRRVSRLVDRFLAWRLPDSVCSDGCASMPGYPHRCGTNLLTADEARQMFEHVLAETEAVVAVHVTPAIEDAHTPITERMRSDSTDQKKFEALRDAFAPLMVDDEGLN